MKEGFQDRIDDYLMGRMTDAERADFEVEVANDNELKEQTIFVETVRQALESRNEKLAAIEDWESERKMMHQYSAKVAADCRVQNAQQKTYASMPAPSSGIVGRPRRKKWIFWTSGIAAMLIVGVFVIRAFVADNHRQDAQYAQAECVAIDDNSEYDAIKLKIKQQQYCEAMSMIKTEALILQHDSVLLTDNRSFGNNATDANLQSFKEKQDELKWLQAVVFVEMGRKDDALLLLNELRQGEGNFKLQADSLYYAVMQ